MVAPLLRGASCISEAGSSAKDERCPSPSLRTFPIQPFLPPVSSFPISSFRGNKFRLRLPAGTISLGSNRDADILLAGTGVEPVHCAIENNNGVVTLHPVNGNTFVDGVPINSPVRLVQGKGPWPKYEEPCTGVPCKAVDRFALASPSRWQK